MNSIKNKIIGAVLKIKRFTLEKTKKSTLRWGIMIGIFASFMLFLFVGISRYIDPNLHKQKIEQFIQERTGHTVVLQGNLYFQCFPTPVLKAENVLVKEQSITAQLLTLYPNFWSLFSDNKLLELELLGAQFKSYHIPKFHTHIAFNQGIIQLKAMKLELLQGKKTGRIEIDHLRIDTLGETPKYHLIHDGSDFPLTFLISLLDTHSNIIEGSTHLKAELTAEGNNLSALKKSLSGPVEMKIQQGHFYGTDLITSLKKAKSFVGTITSKITSPFVSAIQTLVHHRDSNITEKTPFDTIQFHAIFKDGVVNNHDLKIDHQHYGVHGKGYINLFNNTVDYRVKAIYKSSTLEQHINPSALKYAPLIIYISGSLSKPIVKTDFDSYLKFVRKSASNKKPKKTAARSSKNVTTQGR